MTNTLFSYNKYHIHLRQIQYPVTTNTMGEYDLCLNIINGGILIMGEYELLINMSYEWI